MTSLVATFWSTAMETTSRMSQLSTAPCASLHTTAHQQQGSSIHRLSQTACRHVAHTKHHVDYHAAFSIWCSFVCGHALLRGTCLSHQRQAAASTCRFHTQHLHVLHLHMLHSYLLQSGTCCGKLNCCCSTGIQWCLKYPDTFNRTKLNYIQQ